MREFTDFLRDVNGGAFATELSEGLAELVASAKATGKGGSISLTIKIKPTRSGKVMEIEHGCSVKSPDFERPIDYMFATAGNALVRDNPEQQKLELRVTQSNGPHDRVDPSTGEIIRTTAA